MAIAKAVNRSVAFKVARMRDPIMEDQDELIIRKSDSEEVGLEDDNKAAVLVLDDLGYSVFIITAADLYIANQVVVYN